MRYVMVRYRVHADRAQENEALVRAVYDELLATGPDGLRYATFKLDDGLSFMHIAETEEGANPLAETQAFKEFQAQIKDRCQEQPVVSELARVGSYRMLTG